MYLKRIETNFQFIVLKNAFCSNVGNNLYGNVEVNGLNEWGIEKLGWYKSSKSRHKYFKSSTNPRSCHSLNFLKIIDLPGRQINNPSMGDMFTYNPFHQLCCLCLGPVKVFLS